MHFSKENLLQVAGFSISPERDDHDHDYDQGDGDYCEAIGDYKCTKYEHDWVHVKLKS